MDFLDNQVNLIPINLVRLDFLYLDNQMVVMLFLVVLSHNKVPCKIINNNLGQEDSILDLDKLF